MLYLGLGLFAVCVIALDQVVKYLVVAHISLGGIVPVLDGVLHRNPCCAALEEAAD